MLLTDTEAAAEAARSPVLLAVALTTHEATDVKPRILFADALLLTLHRLDPETSLMRGIHTVLLAFICATALANPRTRTGIPEDELVFTEQEDVVVTKLV